MLLDKGYYDYDYEKLEKVGNASTWDETVKSEEEVANMLGMFGFRKKPKTLEEIQNHIIKQESYGS